MFNHILLFYTGYSFQVEKELRSFSTCAPGGHLLRVTIPDTVLTFKNRASYI
jgi:hypothetical protein